MPGDMTTRSGTHKGIVGADFEAAAAPVPQLVIADAQDPARMGERAVLYGANITLGRLESLHVFPQGPLSDDQMSRRHSRITADVDGAYLLEDLGSRNGTFLNGERVTGASRLAHSSVVRVGSTILVYVVEPMLPPCDEPHELVGTAGKLVAIKEAIGRHAGTTSPVLLQGDSGTGKEVAARALHRLGPRADGPFVPVDCPSIPESLFESELFGYEKGAFSGAQARRTGLIEQADGGTLFLDEIGDVPAALQPKLLRVLEGGEFYRIGARRSTRVDIRIVAATNRDLGSAVRNETFRADLFARIAHAIVALPLLRDRRSDIPRLFYHFLEATSRAGRRLRTADMERLMLHSWPLNVRELSSLVDLLAVGQPESSGTMILTPEALVRMEKYAGLEADDGVPTQQPTAPSPLAKPSREQIIGLLEEHGGNISQLAAALGKHRFQVYRLLKRLGLDAQDYR